MGGNRRVSLRPGPSDPLTSVASFRPFLSITLNKVFHDASTIYLRRVGHLFRFSGDRVLSSHSVVCGIANGGVYGVRVELKPMGGSGAERPGVHGQLFVCCRTSQGGLNKYVT